ncbi:MAG TPA: hypothetical protein VGQ57_05335 [Polyangiaceae bacterium]|jgi:hypothetical protein|nr:hypothetical protein [Polyangiaceae bacterium]
MSRSTLLTSPVSFADFVFRLVFFALAPVGIVLAAELFPVRGALIDVGLALAVFFTSETARRLAARFRPASLVLKEALAFESYYREQPPRPFAYYLFYPLLFPYWLTNREARREFWMFRGYTLGSLLVLLGTLAWQYHRDFLPELGLRQFLPAVVVSLVVETLLVLSLLMPIATTVVWYHASFRRRRLLAVLLVGLISTTAVGVRLSSTRDPIVSYLTRKRAVWRTRVAKRKAHAALLEGVMAAYTSIWRARATGGGVDEDGKVEGAPLDAARTALQKLYKRDESFAFDLWASPRVRPRTLVLYAEARPGRPPIWVALKDGAEVRKLSELPKGALTAMREAADTTDPLEMIWESE